MSELRIFLHLSAFLITTGAIASPEYYSPQNKKSFLTMFKHRLYAGCTDLKSPQPPVNKDEMVRLSKQVQTIVFKNFESAFNENKDLKNYLVQEMADLAQDSNCQREANDCRSKLLALPMFYYHRFRADIPGCKAYVTQASTSEKYNINCEGEFRYRQRSLEGVHGTQYGNLGPGNYKKQLIALKNQTTKELFFTVFGNERSALNLCNPVLGEQGYNYNLDSAEPGDYLTNLDPVYDPRKVIPKECVEQKKTLHDELLLGYFDDNRSTVGKDQYDPVKAKVSEFLKSNPTLIVTDVIVAFQSSRTPHYKDVEGRKVIDPESDEKNLSIAKERARFGEGVLEEIRSSSEQYRTINFQSVGKLAGPPFEPVDLNERFVTKLSPGYLERLNALHQKFEKNFKEEALIEGSDKLHDESQYVNLYQAKFKPFHGFRITILGHRKDELKCSDKSGTKPVDSSLRQ